MRSLPSHIKELQIQVLKTLLVTQGLKTKLANIEGVWNEHAILAPWISLENMWDPDVWMTVLFFAKCTPSSVVCFDSSCNSKLQVLLSWGGGHSTQ